MSSSFTHGQLIDAFFAELEQDGEMPPGYKVHHLGLYTWICALRNRASTEVVDLPREHAIKMTGIGSPSTFNTCLDDLASWGLIEIVFRGKNQWTGPTKVKIAGSLVNKHCTSTEPALTTPNKAGTAKRNLSAAEGEEAPSSFDEFWNNYGKKEDRAKCESKWKGLSTADKRAIMEHLPGYLRIKQEVQFRKNPLTYLNGRCWLDEPVLTQGSGKPKPAPPKPRPFNEREIH